MGRGADALPANERRRKLGLMQRLRFTLPPPGLLITFEAAGRLSNFTRAADELNVSRVAVSQQIQALERFVGVPLFERKQRAVELTHVGRRYHRAVTDALRQMVDATVEIRGHADANLVNIGATPGVAAYWLMPGISAFREVHPDIELRLIVSESDPNLAQEGIDVAIRYGEPPFANAEATLLLHQTIAPTCSPAYLARHDVETLEPADLLHHTLIQLDGPFDEQLRWSTWFRAQGVEAGRLRAGMSVNTYTNLVQAALDGQGFALVGPPLMAKFLASGLLVQPVRAEPIARHGFYLLSPRDHAPGKAARAVKAWIETTFGAAATPPPTPPATPAAT